MTHTEDIINQIDVLDFIKDDITNLYSGQWRIFNWNPDNYIEFNCDEKWDKNRFVSVANCITYEEHYTRKIYKEADLGCLNNIKNCYHSYLREYVIDTEINEDELVDWGRRIAEESEVDYLQLLDDYTDEYGDFDKLPKSVVLRDMLIYWLGRQLFYEAMEKLVEKFGESINEAVKTLQKAFRRKNEKRHCKKVLEKKITDYDINSLCTIVNKYL